MAKKTKGNKKSKKANLSNRTNLSNKSNRLPITPLGDRVLVRELAEVEMTKTTASGIILPDSADRDAGAKRGKVIAVGSGRISDGKLIPVSVKVGQTVLYPWGEKIKISGEEYIIVADKDIMAVLNS